ncbi:NepR family anti-sigma factor [Leisingera sp. ANG59]|uniref:NepR family anti-sigma factor n=1 Tax=Leisingera sp. ANG59 TaxID=2675221 RepID=UPI0020C7454A|nr:NepR family anti-sigma factor [Leisingera sp. ANG59]
MDRMTQPQRARPRNKQADREIDENLKRAFEQVASEPVPDRFTDLLKRLKEKEALEKAKQSGESTSND